MIIQMYCRFSFISQNFQNFSVFYKYSSWLPIYISCSFDLSKSSLGIVRGAEFLIKFLNSLLNHILGCLGFKPDKVLVVSITVGNEVLILWRQRIKTAERKPLVKYVLIIALFIGYVVKMGPQVHCKFIFCT